MVIWSRLDAEALAGLVAPRNLGHDGGTNSQSGWPHSHLPLSGT
jgi:hypothetical protein